MSDYMEIPIDDNKTILIELLEPVKINKNEDSILVPVANTKSFIKKSKDYLENSIEQIKQFSSCIAEGVRDINYKPSELELEFAVKFSADAGVIISSVSSEANLAIKVKWNLGEENE